MQVPLRVILDGVERPEEVRAQVREAASVLERFHGRITSCRVAVSNPDIRHHKGGLYDVHVLLRVPGQGDIAGHVRIKGEGGGFFLGRECQTLLEHARSGVSRYLEHGQHG